MDDIRHTVKAGLGTGTAIRGRTLSPDREWWRPRARLRVLVCVAALAVTACGRPPELEEALASDEEVARAVLDGVEREDVDMLMRLAVTREEFADLVWPTLPVSRAEVGMPLDYVWQDTFNKSRAYLARTLQEFGGQRLALVRVEFGGNTTDHGTYSVSRETRLVVKDAENEERTIRLFGSTIRQGGRSKVYSYIVD